MTGGMKRAPIHRVHERGATDERVIQREKGRGGGQAAMGVSATEGHELTMTIEGTGWGVVLVLGEDEGVGDPGGGALQGIRGFGGKVSVRQQGGGVLVLDDGKEG